MVAVMAVIGPVLAVEFALVQPLEARATHVYMRWLNGLEPDAAKAEQLLTQFMGTGNAENAHLSEELRERYHAVVYAVGASSDRSLEIPGEELTGSVAATDLVGWYNGHPDRVALDVPLDHERAVVVGNGNVALDVARILSRPLEVLERTDLAPEALDALRRSAVREVVVLGRRGPAQSAFTVPELIGLAALDDVDVLVDAPADLLTGDDQRTQLLREIAERPASDDPRRRRIVLTFAASPVEVLGADGRVSGVRVARNDLVTDADGVVRAVPTDDVHTLDAGLVIRSVGHRGTPVADQEWAEFREMDPSVLSEVVAQKHIVDGRNALDPAAWRAAAVSPAGSRPLCHGVSRLMSST